MPNPLRKLFQGRLFANIATLYGVQACTYVLPLVTFPYLARTLKPEGWGAVLFSQAIGAVIALVVEYGFDLSATRETARVAGDKSRLRDLVAGVLGAKALLATCAVTVSILARPWTGRVAPSPALFWMSTFWGVAQGINMLWYFQGLQRMRWAGGLDIAGKVIATFAIFAIVHEPSDGWKVMLSQALGCAVSHGLTVMTAYNEVGFRWPTWKLIWESLRLGWPMFLFRSSQTLLTTANGLILGLFASPAAVGLFAGADKIRAVGNQALWPVTQALFPHQAQQVREDARNSVKTVRKSLLVLVSISATFGLVLMVAAPLLIRLVLGPHFADAAPALRIFGLILPISTFGAVICFQWMLPIGFDKEFNVVVLLAGLLNVTLGIFFASRWSVTGMAAAVTIAELFAVLGFNVALLREGVSPFLHLKENPRLAKAPLPEPEWIS